MPTPSHPSFFDRIAWKWRTLRVIAAFLAAYMLVSVSQAVPPDPVRPARYFYALSFTRTTYCFSQVFRSVCPAARLGHLVHLHAQDAGFVNSQLKGPYRSPEEAAQQRAEAIAQYTRKGHYIRGDHIFVDECP